VAPGWHPPHRSLHTDQAHGGSFTKRMNSPHRIGAATRTQASSTSSAGDRKPRRTAAWFRGRSRRGNGTSIGRGWGRPPSRGCSGALHVGPPQSRSGFHWCVLGVAVAAVTRCTLAPSRRMRKTLRAWRRMSSAAHVDPTQFQAEAERRRGQWAHAGAGQAQVSSK